MIGTVAMTPVVSNCNGQITPVKHSGNIDSVHCFTKTVGIRVGAEVEQEGIDQMHMVQLSSVLSD